MIHPYYHTAVIGTSSGPYANIWVGEAEGTTDVSWYHLYAVHITPLNSSEQVPSKTTYAIRLLGLKYLRACGLALISRPSGLSTLDNNKNTSDNNNKSNNNDNNNSNTNDTTTNNNDNNKYKNKKYLI